MATKISVNSTTGSRRKLALIIGNGEYADGQNLPNATNDANDMSSALRSIGFIIDGPKLNQKYLEMRHALVEFEHSVQEGDMVLFYFAGHGRQWEGQNYLIPTDNVNEVVEDGDKAKVQISGPELSARAINVQDFLAGIKRREPFVTIVFLDCCRMYDLRNLNLITRDGDEQINQPPGLQHMTTNSGSLIAFACAPGTVAQDGREGQRNGLFTKYLLEHITTPNVDVRIILSDVINGVMEESDSKQIPHCSFVLRHRNVFLCEQTTGEEGPKISLTVGHPTNDSSNAQTQRPEPTSQNQQITTNQTDGHQSPSDKEQKDVSDERRILLRRGPTGFGFNILGDDTEPGVFVSFVQQGGAADKSGELRKGDQILAVNNTDLRRAFTEDAASLLRNCGDTANLLVVYKYNEFIQLETRHIEGRYKTPREIIGSNDSLKTSTKNQFFVRTEFDYDPTSDISLPGGLGIAFRTGDILCVRNTGDDTWWQAKHVTNEQGEEEVGIIPSKSRVEKEERARQKRVNFNQESISPDSTLDHDKRNAQSGEESENFEPIPSYELVIQHQIDYARPLIIFGPFKELINDQLLNDHPERFASCVPHTSRPKRDNEVDGRDYNFATSREQMERDIQNHMFIEAGEYGGNLYGTTVDAVRRVANASKHCILDVSGHAIQRLINAGLYPITIYVKPRDTKWIVDNMGEDVNQERAQQTFEKCNKIEQQFGKLFTITIQQETLADVYKRICEVIDHEETIQFQWIPSKEKFLK